jgi:hypothetical protein
MTVRRSSHHPSTRPPRTCAVLKGELVEFALSTVLDRGDELMRRHKPGFFTRESMSPGVVPAPAIVLEHYRGCAAG